MCNTYWAGMKLAIILLSLSPRNFVFPITFYEPLNVQNQICELCTFPVTNMLNSMANKLCKLELVA